MQQPEQERLEAMARALYSKVDAPRRDQPKLDPKWGLAVKDSDVRPEELTELEAEGNPVVSQHRNAQASYRGKWFEVTALQYCQAYESAPPARRAKFRSPEERFGEERVAWAHQEKAKHGSWDAAIGAKRKPMVRTNMDACSTGRRVVEEVRKRRQAALRLRRVTPPPAPPRRSRPASAIVVRVRRSVRRPSAATSLARDGTDGSGDPDPPPSSFACSRPPCRLGGGASWR